MTTTSWPSAKRVWPVRKRPSNLVEFIGQSLSLSRTVLLGPLGKQDQCPDQRSVDTATRVRGHACPPMSTDADTTSQILKPWTWTRRRTSQNFESRTWMRTRTWLSKTRGHGHDADKPRTRMSTNLWSRLCGSNFWTLIILKSPNDLESRVNTNSTLISLWKLKFDIWTCLIRPNTSFYCINSPIFSNIMRL